MDANDPRLRTWGIGIGIVLMSLALVDLVALKGDPVASASVSLRADSEPGTLSIDRIGEEHLLKISTRRTVRGKTEGQSITYRLEAPDGSTVAEESELISRKQRYVSFTPTQPGDYVLHAEETKLLGASRGTARASVTANDRRVLSRLLGF